MNVAEMSLAIVTFYGSASLPDATRAKLAEAIASGGLQAIITAMEALYAARADLDEAGIELLDGLARFVGQHRFYGKGERAALIAGVVARIAAGGEAEEEGDPALEAAFTPPVSAASEAVLALAAAPEEPEA